ncbi:MAG: hypothetical protein PHR64_02680 [Candidatus Shapirobacteria bacterium]|nr:hypothetical protein [Candidatus Shapirobacteria bacterium]MDD5073827.1 hypothetical protein [Candidatus Shapirobacteria bacterium]MDD5481827.1 hypothetical protein [Candidatus Shapirobacteria bacterium]
MTERPNFLPYDYSPTRFAQDLADLEVFEEAGLVIGGSKEALWEARREAINRYRFPQHQIPPLKKKE